MEPASPKQGFQRTASIQDRVKAIQAVLDEHGLNASAGVQDLDHLAQEEWVPMNGARVVARAWIDPAFRARLLADGRAAVTELGLPMPKHHRHLVVLENTATVHNVICCSLCSCTAFTIIGLPPDWYKDFEYRSRIVRESRTVLKEMGLDLPPESRSACGTRQRIPATWCCRCSRRRPLAGRKTNLYRSSRAIR